MFIQIKDASRVPGVYSQLQTFVENNNRVREDFQVKEFVLDPFTSIAHIDRSNDNSAATWGAPPISAVIGSNVMGILIILLACFNLTNTSIAISSRRLKEIGVRKVMGAKTGQIVGLMSSEFVRLILIALVIAVPLAWYGMEQWLNGFAYKISINAMVFVYAGLAALAIALITVSFESFRAASTNPVNSLRSE